MDSGGQCVMIPLDTMRQLLLVDNWDIVIILVMIHYQCELLYKCNDIIFKSI